MLSIDRLAICLCGFRIFTKVSECVALVVPTFGSITKREGIQGSVIILYMFEGNPTPEGVFKVISRLLELTTFIEVTALLIGSEPQIQPRDVFDSDRRWP